MYTLENLLYEYENIGRSAVAEMAEACHFLLVNILNNTNIHPILHCFYVIAQYWSSFFLLSTGVPYTNAIFLSNSEHVLLKTRFFGLHFCRRVMGIASTTLTHGCLRNYRIR